MASSKKKKTKPKTKRSKPKKKTATAAKKTGTKKKTATAAKKHTTKKTAAKTKILKSRSTAKPKKPTTTATPPGPDLEQESVDILYEKLARLESQVTLLEGKLSNLHDIEDHI